MKRILACAAALLLLCACGAEPTGSTTAPTTTATATAATTVTTAATEDVIVKTEASKNTTLPNKTTVAATETTSTLAWEPTVKRTTTSRTSVKTTALPTAANNGITLLEPADGVIVESQSLWVEEYLAIDNAQEAAEFWVASYTGQAKAASFTAHWKSDGMLWRVFVSEDPTFANVKGWLTTDNSMRVSNLLPGRTYYWKVTTGNGVESEVRTVKVKDTQVRWIEAEGTDNVRDLGGWKTESGKRVKYGMLYRGACIDGYKGAPQITTNGIQVFKDQLGIRTQLDLRGDDANVKSNVFGGLYVNATLSQYDYIFNSASSKAALGKIFKTLSQEMYYPVYFHCNAGADRTGTLSFIINGLLGVSHEDLTRDFELTSFSHRGRRLRSAIDTDSDPVKFKANGVMQNGGGNYIAWGPLYNTMMQDYGTTSGKLSDAIANFLITECGVTQAQIDTFRQLMLE